MQPGIARVVGVSRFMALRPQCLAPRSRLRPRHFRVLGILHTLMPHIAGSKKHSEERAALIAVRVYVSVRPSNYCNQLQRDKNRPDANNQSSKAFFYFFSLAGILGQFSYRVDS